MKTRHDQPHKNLSTAELVETLAAYPAADLAVILVEATRNVVVRLQLDSYQNQLLPLTALSNKPHRERIHRLRLICGLLITNPESKRHE